MITALEELSLNAWPALQTVHYDGWLLRCAAGYTRRANSVQPLYGSTLNLAEKIAYCEQVYAACGRPTVFKLTPAARPAGLEAALAEAGYRTEAPTSVQTASLADLPPAPDVGTVTLADQATESWLAAFCALNTVAARHQPTMAQMLARIVPARCFLALEQEGAVVAVGLAVAERGWVGLFDLVTAVAWRNRGLGRQVILRLLHWGRAQGARQAYLQVMSDNAPALHLYETLGFREAYPYWYRVK